MTAPRRENRALSPEVLSTLATGRQRELFSSDVEARTADLRARVSGARALVIGGAGSIGAATVRALLAFEPAALHVVDLSENNLVELVRDLRSSPPGVPARDFRTLPIDFGSPVMRRLLQEEAPYDLILNFAALKHVRSEKDIPSLLQMLDVNIVKCARLLRWLRETQKAYRYFCVSTDKAARPVNLMGASKRVMEAVIFADDAVPKGRAAVTSARFPNVAFSDGSLLHGFLNRLRKQQPLAVPVKTGRYFVTLREAGSICLLAAVCAPDRHLLIPRVDGQQDLRDLQEVAETVLRAHGLEPRHYHDEAEARHNVARDLADGHYPLLLTPLDTMGEKPFEEFVDDGERAVDAGMKDLLAVAFQAAPAREVERVVAHLEDLVAHPDRPAVKEDIVRLVSSLVPSFRHAETGRSLDQRM
jgi:FlaA1/EpsC-like NDP-sugar epimerase